ncbi:MAG: hypothetical protein U0T75_03825 [Chitinophagales bacterium]
MVNTIQEVFVVAATTGCLYLNTTIITLETFTLPGKVFTVTAEGSG